jgi:hypothetical protein
VIKNVSARSERNRINSLRQVSVLLNSKVNQKMGRNTALAIVSHRQFKIYNLVLMISFIVCIY